MPATYRRYTAAEARDFRADGNKYEVIRGELHVTPAPRPRHEIVIAAEVVVPSSRRGDRVEKRRLYQDQRVARYWVVDHEAGLVEAWEPNDERPLLVADTLSWQITPDTPELRIDLPELFGNLPS